MGFRFSTTVLDVLWELLDLGEMPVRIAVDRRGTTAQERERVRAAALTEAARLDLGEWPDLDRRLTGLLDVLARHDRAVDLRELGGRRRTALAAASGGRAALAITDGEVVTVTAVDRDRLVTELLGLLPAAPPGPGRACSVPSAVLERAMRALAESTDSDRARAILRPAGIGGGDVEQLLRIARTTTGTGSIGVYRGPHGKARLAGSLAYLDTTHGRYLVLQRNDLSGRPYTTVIPTDVDTLRRHVHQLL